jgi:hypothetical protein
VSNLSTAQKLAFLFVAWMVLSGGSIGAPSKATAAVYVYEKSRGGIPPHVGSAIGKLNERDILATTHEDGPGVLPKQYEFAVPAAREAGLPSFVTMAGDRSVVKVVKSPATEQAVLEAVP